jgi:iron complex outermembrane receptor protein
MTPPNTSPPFLTRVLLGALLGNALATARLAAQDTAQRLPATVSVARGSQQTTLNQPLAISVLTPDSLRPGQTHLQIDQTLFLLPGLTISNRFNPTQDTRIAIRGFGARSQFGARSIRILRDGMPLTLPDGQTPIDYLDLEAVGRIEVIRGTAAALYGNASGGVIDIRSAPPPTRQVSPEIRLWVGSDSTRRLTALVGGTTPRFWYQANVGRTVSSSYRDYGDQRLTNGFARAGTTLLGTDFTLTALGLDVPVSQNPGALTRSLFDSIPRSADALSRTRKARKEVNQTQIGLSASRATPVNGRVSAQVYNGDRSLYNPLTFAVVGVQRATRGGSVQWSGWLPKSSLRPETRGSLTVGYDYQWMGDDRRNWGACNGLTTPTANCPTLGEEKGSLTLDQRELAHSSGAYVRAEWMAPRMNTSLGLRADRVAFEVRDNFATDGRDDSGSRTMSAFSPMLGISVPLSSRMSAYGNFSTAFETPTTVELGNDENGNAGFNPNLEPQSSATTEVGVKGSVSRHVTYDAAVFATNVRDELIPFDINGRTFYRNAGKTRRTGAELAAMAVVRHLELAGALTVSSFRFDEFVVGTTSYAGNAIPGIPDRQLQLSATWRAADHFLVAEWQGKDKVYVNDANTASAPGYALVNLRAGNSMRVHGFDMATIIGVNNLFDRKYVSSVAVNAAGTATTGKFYEPGAGLSVMAGVQIRP